MTNVDRSNWLPHQADVVPEAQLKRTDGLLLLVGSVVDRKYLSGDLPANDQELLLWNIFVGGMDPRAHTALKNRSSMSLTMTQKI